jgi:hypothetical protein
MQIDSTISYLQEKAGRLEKEAGNLPLVEKAYKDRITVEKIMAKHGKPSARTHDLDYICKLDYMILIENMRNIWKALDALEAVRHI